MLTVHAAAGWLWRGQVFPSMCADCVTLLLLVAADVAAAACR
jgi:hypothetical protein